jgi:TonB family protein
MRFSALLPFALYTLASCWTSPAFGQPAPPPAAQVKAESLGRAFKLLADGQFRQAKEELDRATALAEGPCGECLLGLSHVYASNKKWDQAVDAAQQAIPLLKSPGAQARAYNQLGIAYSMLKASDGLTKAEEALRRAMAAGGPWGALARYNLAEVLLRRQRWAEAAEEARGYLKEAGPAGTSLKEARIVLCRARGHLPEEPWPEKQPGNPVPKPVKGEVQRPEIIFQQRPVYPQEAREANTRGKVVVESIIDDEGCVRNVRALKERPNGLTKAAIEAARQWVFLPATFGGKPVKVYYVLTVNFH